MQKIDDFSLEYYHDEHQTLDFDAISKIKFETLSNKFSLGYVKGDSWFKFTVDNNSQQEVFILYLSEPFFSEVNFFEYYQGKWTKQSSGLDLFLKYGNKKDINPTFKIHIKPQSKAIFYIQIHHKSSDKTLRYGEFKIYSQEAPLYEYFFSDFMLYTFYFGTIFIIILFNIFLFITLKEAIYAYYIGFVFFHALFILSYSSLLYYMGCAKYYNMVDITIPIFLLFFTLFSRELLNIKTYLPRIDKILQMAILALSVSIPLILIDYHFWFSISTQITTLFAPFLIYASLYIFFKGYMELRYYIFSTITFLISMGMLSLMTEGLISNSNFNHYFYIFASYFEIIFFAFILANRFNKIQQEIIIIKEKNEQVLEKKVLQRTYKVTELLKDKELLLREVYHRVKNNFQMVIALITIDSSNESEQNLDLINRIKSMSMIHEYILNSNTFSEIKSDEYLLKIINENQKFNIQIETKIDSCTLSLEEAMALGVISNEVLNNAVKHHPEKDKCKISFTFERVDRLITLTIKDNGLGFSKEEHYESFGLEMIDEFASKLKSSHIEFIADEGTKFVLSFELLEAII